MDAAAEASGNAAATASAVFPCSFRASTDARSERARVDGSALASASRTGGDEDPPNPRADSKGGSDASPDSLPGPAAGTSGTGRGGHSGMTSFSADAAAPPPPGARGTAAGLSADPSGARALPSRAAFTAASADRGEGGEGALFSFSF